MLKLIVDSNTNFKIIPVTEIKEMNNKQRNEVENGSFQQAAGKIFAIAQFWGIMPVVGVTNKSTSALRFEWTAFRTIHSIVSSILLTGWAIMCFVVLFITEFNFSRMTPVIFFSSAASCMWYFVNLARKWPEIMIKFEKVETKLPVYDTEKEKNRLAVNIKIYAITFFIFAITDHLLTVMSDIYYVKACRPEYDTVAGFFEKQLIQLFSFTEFTLWKGIFGKTVQIIGAFIWNYTNVFIVIIAITLSSRFKQINENLMKVISLPMSEDYWEIRRDQYRSLAELCDMADEALAPITFIAMANNLFFICVQLLKSLQPQPSAAHAVYFWFSLTFLLSRTLAFVLFTSAIHDESKRPIIVLRELPNWCTEAERFLEHAVNSRISLSGGRFFFLTRKLILSAAGVILTYEIILLQYNPDENDLLCDDI